MFESLTLEKLSNKNFKNFLFLIEKLAEYEKSPPLDDGAEVRLKKDGLSKNPRYGAYLGKIEGEYVSYAIFYETYSSYLALPTLYLEDIFVLEKYRCNGIGQRMFDFCVQKTKERGCGRMEWCVYNWNESAIKFYGKNKATCLDKVYYRLDANHIENFMGGKQDTVK